MKGNQLLKTNIKLINDDHNSYFSFKHRKRIFKRKKQIGNVIILYIIDEVEGKFFGNRLIDY